MTERTRWWILLIVMLITGINGIIDSIQLIISGIKNVWETVSPFSQIIIGLTLFLVLLKPSRTLNRQNPHKPDKEQ